MKQRKRTLAWLLCLCLMLGILAGCGNGQAGTARGTEVPDETPEPTPEPIDYGAMYTEAAARLSAEANWSASYRITQEIILPDYAVEPPATLTLTEETSRSVRLQGLGSETLLGEVSETFQIGSEKVQQRQLYSDGILFIELGDARYYASLSAEDFVSSQIPAALLDASLYETAEGEESETGITIRFSDPTDAERWAVPDNGELLSASGTAELDANGTLTAANYELRYRFCGVEIAVRYEATVEAPAELELSGEMPANTKGYESLDSAEAPMMLLRARAFLESATALSVTKTANYYTEAGGVVMRGYDNLHVLDSGEDLRLREKTSVSLTDYSSMQGYSI